MRNNPSSYYHRLALGVFVVFLLLAVCWPAIDAHIGRAFILRAPTTNPVDIGSKLVDESSPHKDSEPVRIWGATDDGLPHVTHELKGAR